MRDIKDLCARIEDELSKIADNGLTTGNLEMTYKLIDMYKDIKNTQYWDKKVEYYNTVLDEMRSGYNDDYSERGRKRGRWVLESRLYQRLHIVRSDQLDSPLARTRRGKLHLEPSRSYGRSYGDEAANLRKSLILLKKFFELVESRPLRH